VVHVKATPAGINLMQRGRQQRVQRLVRLLEDLDLAELETIGTAAERLAQLLRQPRARAK